MIKKISDIYLSIFLSKRFFLAAGIIVLLSLLSFVFDWVHAIVIFSLILLFVLLLVDLIVLFAIKEGVKGKRELPSIFSINAENKIGVTIENKYSFKIDTQLYDELPEQLQMRDEPIKLRINRSGDKCISYSIKPMSRGIHSFGHLYLFVSTWAIGLWQRRYILAKPMDSKIYPSVKHMRDVQLLMISNISDNTGVKKIRRMGHSYEFDQIKTYVQGDDYRSINWKATGRRGGNLMINQYEDEKAQPVYFAIDRSRNMKMPFNGLSLLDYSINSALALSNIAISKQDKAGIICFDKKCDGFVKAENGKYQLNRILEELYNQEQADSEADFNNFYASIKQFVRQRSLIFLFTNCNTQHSLKRMKPILQLLNKLHLLVVVLFENDEISNLTKIKSTSLEDIYDKTIAENFIYEQQLIALELNTSGVQCIVSKPEELTINSINKYLELKARGLA